MSGVLLDASADEQGSAVLVGTHELDLLARCDRRLTVRDGRVAELERR